MHHLAPAVVLALAACGVSAQGTPKDTSKDTASVTIDLVDVSGSVRALGTVALSDSPYGLVLKPALKGLPHGVHGFHVHTNPSCAAGEREGQRVAALAAGGHLDPKNTNKHGAPWEDDAHLGDLPGLTVDHDGSATTPVLAPRLTVAQVKGRSLMVHVGGDNHSDHPAPLGGGGARLACGVIAR